MTGKLASQAKSVVKKAATLSTKQNQIAQLRLNLEKLLANKKKLMTKLKALSKSKDANLRKYYENILASIEEIDKQTLATHKAISDAMKGE